MARELCSHCGFSVKTCLCDSISIINNRLKIIILRHPNEEKVTKNTANLLNLGLDNCQILAGESEQDFLQLATLPKATTAVLYPADNALCLDEHTATATADAFKQSLTHLIVIDGTWKKAYKMLQLTPSLQGFQAVSFKQIPQNKYVIRKAPRADSLSTLEAVAHSLKLIEGLDVTPLYKLLAALVDKQTQHMPDNVKARYL
ncbi:tRNA-uridine aminocarboxypropyltransferase [uncultured Pseudoalteromonas sp.]|uniref:tRNA-uridine aminocarboxypropyltransferase n=1 Tax=Pseudoalteromonas sp. TaxID=53249 RepID=UPI0025913AAE|nr:tRNA-uridine aminocarboxypropyltransferase [uncultured Pseudoalteromonas sp.]